MNICKVLVAFVAMALSDVVVSTSVSAGVDAKVDSILCLIDDAVEHHDVYVGQRRTRIGTLRKELAKAQSDEARYEISFSLFEEYKPFVKDSAIIYLDNCIASARCMSDSSQVAICLAHKAYMCSNTGAYVESLDILKSLDPSGLTPEAQQRILVSRSHVFGEIATYSPLSESRVFYGVAAQDCLSSLFHEADPMSQDVILAHELNALNSGDTATSMRYSNLWLDRVERGSTDFALFALYRYLEFKARLDTTNMLLWLGESVLADIRNGVQDQGSMWEMSNQLILMGQVDRAYRYICYTSECANRFGSRQRLSRISPLLTMIAQRYKAEGEGYQSRLRLTLFCISLLAVLLLLFVIFIAIQRNKLRKTRDRLAQSNDALSEVNKQLMSANAELTSLSEQRRMLNTQLAEANKVKEEYVGRFMSLCSRYVERLDDLRKKVRNKVKNGQTAELNALLRSSELNTHDMEELYVNFDTAFLHLFPDFVEQFNSLLTPENRTTEPQPGRLTTQMRIFALIRLGITDSGRISEILHYSVNTIYNYRAQTKKLSACGKDDFEERVKEIGVIGGTV